MATTTEGDQYGFKESTGSLSNTRLGKMCVLIGATLFFGLISSKIMFHEEVLSNGLPFNIIEVDRPQVRRMSVIENGCILANTDLLLPLHHKDMPFAPLLFKSIELNLPCFKDLVIVVPPESLDELGSIAPSWARIFVVPEPLPEPFGYLSQQVIKMYSDSFTTGDYVFILEADMVFREWKDECFFADSNRIKAYCAHFERDTTSPIWRKGTEHAIARSVEHDCCVHTPFIFPREMFPGLRAWIKSVHKKPFEEFMMDYYEGHSGLWDEDKVLFSEFNIMNHYMFHFMPDRIQLIEGRDPDWSDLKGVCAKHIGQLVKRNFDLENPKLTNEYFKLASAAMNHKVQHEKLTLDISQ